MKMVEYLKKEPLWYFSLQQQETCPYSMCHIFQILYITRGIMLLMWFIKRTTFSRWWSVIWISALYELISHKWWKVSEHSDQISVWRKRVQKEDEHPPTVFLIRTAWCVKDTFLNIKCNFTPPPSVPVGLCRSTWKNKTFVESSYQFNQDLLCHIVFPWIHFALLLHQKGTSVPQEP